MRWRCAWLAVCSAALLAGCGGGSRPLAGPRLPRPLAHELAARADALGRDLAAGRCARPTFDALQRDTIRAVNAHRVPAAFQEELLAAVNGIAVRPCARIASHVSPAPAPAAAPRPRGHGHGHGHGKAKGHHGKHDDE